MDEDLLPLLLHGIARQMNILLPLLHHRRTDRQAEENPTVQSRSPAACTHMPVRACLFSMQLPVSLLRVPLPFPVASLSVYPPPAMRLLSLLIPPAHPLNPLLCKCFLLDHTESNPPTHTQSKSMVTETSLSPEFVKALSDLAVPHSPELGFVRVKEKQKWPLSTYSPLPPILPCVPAVCLPAAGFTLVSLLNTFLTFSATNPVEVTGFAHVQK